MNAYFKQFSDYNRWANARISDAVPALNGENFYRPIGRFFRNIHGTLNQILLADRVWMNRITGHDKYMPPIDSILYEDRRK